LLWHPACLSSHHSTKEARSCCGHCTENFS
jgi:hypothetical protein